MREGGERGKPEVDEEERGREGVQSE